MTTERIGSALAICIVLPAALGIWDALAGGAAGLEMLWWLVRREKR